MKADAQVFPGHGNHPVGWSRSAFRQVLTEFHTMGATALGCQRRFNRGDTDFQDHSVGVWLREETQSLMHTFFSSVKNRRASKPPSRPTPELFMPPKGVRRS